MGLFLGLVWALLIIHRRPPHSVRGVVTLGRKLVPLGPETLDLLPAPCRRCVFWELGAKARPRGSEEAATPEGGLAVLGGAGVGAGRARRLGGRGGGRLLAVRPDPRARPGRVPGRPAGEPGRRPAGNAGRPARVRGTGDRPGPSPDDGPRPDQAEGAGGGGLRRPGRRPAAPAGSPPSSWRPAGSRSSATTPATRSCAWTCAPPSRGRTPGRRPWRCSGSRPPRSRPCDRSPPRDRTPEAVRRTAERAGGVPPAGKPRHGTSPTHRGRARLLECLGQLRNSESSLTMLRFGMAPISRFFSTPPMNRASVGMLMTP